MSSSSTLFIPGRNLKAVPLTPRSTLKNYMVNIHHKTICFITSSPSKLCYCYIIQLKFICATVFLLNTIHSTRSPKAVHLTPRSIQCYHPPPPLHHLLQQEFKINTSNCKRHSCPKAIKALQLQMVCPTTLLLLCLFPNHSNIFFT